MAVNLGWASGTVIGGLLADWDWRWLFLGDGLTTLAYGVLVYFAIPETRPQEAVVTVGGEAQAAVGPGDSPTQPVVGRGLTNPLRDGVFLATTSTGLLFTLIFCCHLSILPLTVTRSAGYPAVVFGLLAGVNGVLVAIFEISITQRLKGFRRLRLAALGCLLSALGFGMIGLFMHWAWFLLAVFVFTAGEILASPQQIAFVADWAPPEARGRYLSLYQATWSVAFAVNPAITLPLHAALGERAFWGLMPLVAVPGVLMLWHLDKTADRPELLRGLAPGGLGGRDAPPESVKPSRRPR
jgi:MFS family permease